ncbi:MAG: D-alanyl-D-alanine carboxypeptidase family protein, partial [Myxococcaceae bacterium]|nr:D-alanyl-D-alanine carboxypeptidase family protein [Myxococcaceae bacterium]
GLAVDLSYSGLEAESWLAAHAHEHGFTLSYPRNAQRQTGFHWEPWHFRFVGADVASTLHERPGLSLEQLFEETPGLGESGDCSDCPLPESKSTCDGLDTAGRCDGETMRWCFKGAANAVDCRLIAERCTADAGARICVP